MRNKESKDKKHFLYLLPMLILILNQSISFIAFSTRRSINTLAFQDDISQLIIRGIAYGIAFFIFCLNFRENIKLLKKCTVFVILTLYILLSMYWSHFPLKVFINWGHFIGMVLVILAARIYLTHKLEKVFPTFSIILGLSVLISLFAVYVVPNTGVDHDGRWQGFSGNANSLGVISIASIWASLAGLYKNQGMRMIYLFTLIFSIVILIGSGSKTSLLVGLFIYLFMHILVSLERASNIKRFLVLGVWSFMGVILILSIYLIMPEVLGLEGAMNVLGRDTTFSGRTRVWEHAWKLFLEKPIHGWGFDSTMSVHRFTVGKLGQFHSGYLDLLVRGGIVGLCLVTMIYFRIIKNLLASEKQFRRDSMLFLSIVLAILIHNLSEASLARGTHLFWYIIMFTYFFFAKNKQKKVEKK